jgi:hypothetical protein
MMSDELLEMVLRYLNEMAQRGDHEAQQLFNMIGEQQ